MAEMAVSANGEVLRALLGSCLGLALYDPRHKMGGLAHIVLPSSNGNPLLPAKFVDTAIPSLIEELKQFADRRLNLIAKMAGGADMFSSQGPKPIGLKNIEAAEHLLAELQIPVVGRHLGGQQGRRMQLDTGSGRVSIQVVGADPVEL